MSCGCAETAGAVTNLMSNDAERLFEATSSLVVNQTCSHTLSYALQVGLYMHYIWASPLFVLTVLLLAYTELGVAALVGFGLLLLSIPLQAVLGV